MWSVLGNALPKTSYSILYSHGENFTKDVPQHPIGTQKTLCRRLWHPIGTSETLCQRLNMAPYRHMEKKKTYVKDVIGILSAHRKHFTKGIIIMASYRKHCTKDVIRHPLGTQKILCQRRHMASYVTVLEKTRFKSKTAILDNAHLKVQTLCISC